MFSFSFSGRCSTQLHSEDTRTTTLQAAPKVTNFLFLSAFIHIVLPYSGFINAQNIKLWIAYSWETRIWGRIKRQELERKYHN